jgi:hypothetical protein
MKSLAKAGLFVFPDRKCVDLPVSAVCKAGLNQVPSVSQTQSSHFWAIYVCSLINGGAQAGLPARAAI